VSERGDSGIHCRVNALDEISSGEPITIEEGSQRVDSGTHGRSKRGRLVKKSSRARAKVLHRKKPRLPDPCRKVPTAVPSIGTAHAAPEVPDLSYA
jgi:hypothetical protein